ncbi:MAG: ATP-binding cassette domain-containing protein [Planctomycetota bacterium]
MNAFDLAAQYEGFRIQARASWQAPAVALFGASGSGKTTIVEGIAGLRPEVTGMVTIGGRRLDRLPPEQRRIGWVPQDASLFPHMTVRANIEFASQARGSPAAVARAIDALEIGSLLDRGVRGLSGGERQRVAIARAIASEPDCLLLDEPLASVDRPLRARIIPYLARIPAQTGVPMLIVTHDPHEVVALASYVIVLETGRVVAQGNPRDVLASPAAFGVLDALSAENVFHTRLVARGSGTLSLETAAGCRLEMALVSGFPEPTCVAIRSEDVMLAARFPEMISAQNILPGRVERLDALGEHTYVRIRSSGELWVAKVTARAVAHLHLAPEQLVYMLIKAHAILPCA